MAGRKTVYNNITSPEKLAQCNKNNIELGEEFLDYLRSVDRAETTIKQYESDLKIFWCWNYEYNKNKDFIKITKREFAKMQNHCLNVWGWSPKRVRRFKSTISSMSNFIMNILDEEEEFEGYRSTIRKIESPVNEPVREKSVFTEEQLQKLLDTLVENKKYQAACAVSLAMCCGARKSELTRFKVEYFDESNILYDAIYKTPEKLKTKGRGKGKFLYKYVLIDFKKYLDLWLEERKRLGIDSEWLFVTKDKEGNYVQASITLLDSYAETCTRILEMPFYFHSLRHYLTTRFRQLNLPSKIIVEWTGWCDESLIQIYDDSEASDDFGKYFTAEGIVKQEEKGLQDLK